MAKEWGDWDGSPWGSTGPWTQLPSLGPPRETDPVPTDVVETDDALWVKVDLPGVDRDAVDVILDRDLLTIRAIRREPPPEARLVHRLGRSHGMRKTSVMLPVVVALEGMQVEADGGVVTICLPKVGGGGTAPPC